jgi:hypothetical protein
MQKLKTIALLLVLTIPLRSFACACSGVSSLEQSIGETAFVAGIQVLHVDTLKIKQDSKDRPEKLYAKYTALLTEKFKGSSVGDTIFIYTTFSDCGYFFKPGLKYILFAELTPFKDHGSEYPVGRNTFWTNSCTYTSIFSDGSARAVKNALRPGADKVVPGKLNE